MKTGGTYIPADKEVANKLKEIVQRLTEIVEKLYPSPVKEVSLDVPFSEHDVLTIELGRPGSYKINVYKEKVGKNI